jgi:hypothetical protein
VKQTDKRHGIRYFLHGKLYEKRMSPHKESRMSWVIKSGETLWQVRIVYDMSQGSVERL